jgi:hypothetical protein
VSEPATDVSAALEAALLRELAAVAAWENQARFGSTLRPAVFALSPATTRLGCWRSATRTIELSRGFVLDAPWHQVIGVLAHELAHQYVDEVLRVTDETAHGETFRRICAERGIDALAVGLPTSSPAAGGAAPEVARVLERIRKLLALAGSANRHEAASAMKRAHELMLRHNIETAGSHAAADFEVAHLGDPTVRGNRVEAEVAGLLAELFFVEVIRVPVYLPRLGKRGLVYEVIGTRPNVAMARHVHAFLLATCDRLWRDARRAGRVSSGRDRLSYQTGVIRGFRDKLAAERSALRGTGLVWRGDRDLKDLYRARNPRITTRTSRIRLDGAHSAGREAGRSVVLHKPVERGPAGPRQGLLGR